MPPPLLHPVHPASLPQHCEPSSSILAAISSYLHTCIPTSLALSSSVLGTCSIISWLFAQLPQIYKNYQLQSTSGLSIYFLVEWCLGDTSNLIGALLTRQAAWQVVIAAYYVLVDITLVIQFFWYTHFRSREVVYGEITTRSHHDHGDVGGFLDGVSVCEENSYPARQATSRDAGAKNGSDSKFMNSTVKNMSPASSNGQSPSYSNEKFSRRPTRTVNGSSPPGLASTRTLLITSLLCAVAANASPTDMPLNPPIHTSTNKTALEIIGRIFSWLSTLLYLASRPPQLYKNYNRKSTAGLSPLLFIAAFSGNLFYSASLLSNPYAWTDMPPHGGHGWADSGGNNCLDWISRSIPFFLGAFGVLFLDGFMGVQFIMYGVVKGQSGHDEEVVVRVDDRKYGGSHWERVQGWMRGWIPSIAVSPRQRPASSPFGQVSQEGQALLGEEREREGERYGAV